MKLRSDTDPNSFRPVTLSFTLESEGELEIFKQIFRNHRKGQTPKVVVQMRQRITNDIWNK